MEARKTTSRRILISVVIGLALIGIGVSLILFTTEMWVQIRLLPQVESRYGGLIVGEVHQVGSDYHERLTITDIQPGSAFDQAGIQNNDVVLTNDSIGDFAKRLDAPSGTQINLVLVPGGKGPPFSQRPSRSVVVTAP